MGIIAYLLIFGFLFINMGELFGGKGGGGILNHCEYEKKATIVTFF